MSGLACELVVGLVAGLLADPTAFRGRLVVQLVGALTLGITLMLGLSGWRGEGQARPQELVTNRRQDRVVGFVVGLVLGLAAGVVAVRLFHLGFVVGFVTWLVVGFVSGLMPRLASRFVAGFVVGFADCEPSPQGPRESWRHDRVFGLRVGLVLGVGIGVGIGIGIVLVLGAGLGPMFGVGPRVGLVLGLVFELVNFFAVVLLVGLLYGITSSVTWPTTLAWRQLRRSHRVPAVALMPFLEDARGRHVLRTVGAVYQFRHATLQDQLAGQTTTSPPTSLVTQIGA